MVIGIVIDKLYPGKIGGAEQYIRNLINIWGRMEDVRMILFLNEYAMDSFETIESKGTCRVCVPEDLNDAEKYYEYYVAKYDIRVLFCPLFYVPCEHCSVPMVSLIHDIQYEYFPEYFSDELLQYRREETIKAVIASTAVITISEFSKNTIVEKLSVNRDKVYVIYENSDSSFDDNIIEETNIRIKQQLPTSYIVYPANGWPHKNHKRLIDAYKILKDEYHTESKLVLTGNAINDDSGLQEYIRERSLDTDVISLGYIQQEEMPYVFRNAKMLVFPSLFEGFGIPLVEAMRVGIPIVCSKSASIPEIVKDAAIFFDANDAYDMAKKIHLVENDNELCKELIQKGTKRAMAFSWEKCAEQTLKVLEKQLVEWPKDNQRRYQMPQLTLLVPVYSELGKLQDLLDSVEKQEYGSKKVVIFTKKKGIYSRLTKLINKYSMNLEVVTQNNLSNVLDRIINEDKKGIIGVLQVGQIFETPQVFDDIVVELVQSQRDICWVKPKREGFWGLQLHNNLKSSTYQRFIDFDQVSCSLLFLSRERRTFLTEIRYWFNGHYQQIIFGDAIIKKIEQSSVKNAMITDNSSLTVNMIKEYRESLYSIWEKNHYIPLSIVNRNNILQNGMIRNLIHSNYDIKRYYEQIDKKGIEFDRLALDGWISRYCELEIELQDNDNELFIVGENNVLLNRAIMKIMIDNEKVIYDDVVHLGRFTEKIYIPSSIIKGKHILRLEMKNTFSCFEKNKSDIRALSIRITKMSINDIVIWETYKD